MSWSLSYPSRKAFESDERPEGSKQVGEGEPHVKEQIDAARSAAQQLIESGVVGAKDRNFYVTLSGHANPEHKGNDSVSIYIGQQS